MIGRSYYIGGQQRTVIGVMGPDFRFPRDGVTLWITAVIRPEDIATGPVRDGAGRADAARRDACPTSSASWLRWRSGCPSGSAGRRRTPT